MLDAPPPPSHPCDVSRVDFASYLADIATPFVRFTDVCLHASIELAASNAEGAPATSGLAAYLREVLALFFKEDFVLEDGPIFKATYPLGDGTL